MNTAPSKPSRFAWINVALVLSALVLAGVLASFLRRGFERGATFPLFDNQAMAAVTSQAGGYSMLTANSNNEEIVLVLDARREQLMVYRAENTQSVQPLQRVSLPQMFTEARAKQLNLPMK